MKEELGREVIIRRREGMPVRMLSFTFHYTGNLSYL